MASKSFRYKVHSLENIKKNQLLRFDRLPTALGHVMDVCDLTQILGWKDLDVDGGSWYPLSR